MVPFEHEPSVIDEYRIAFTLKTPELATRYAIDRVTGSMSAEAKATNGGLVGNVRGKCDKAEAITRF